MRPSSMMIGASVAALAVTALVLPAANAEISTTDHETAIEVCSTVNPLQPVELINAVEDGSGFGFSLVWLNDKDGNLWLCDADANGNVYSYTLVGADLLEGTGAELIGIQLASDGKPDAEPQEVAQKVCAAYVQDGKVLAVTYDGLAEAPGFAIFVQDGAGALYLCNATGGAAVWAFEPMGDPISFGDEVS